MPARRVLARAALADKANMAAVVRAVPVDKVVPAAKAVLAGVLVAMTQAEKTARRPVNNPRQ